MTAFRLGTSCSAVILALVLLQCTNTVLTQSPTPPPPSPDTCRNYTIDGDCRFYSECVTDRIASCSERGYALEYGLTYCNRFIEHREKFDGDLGQQWIDDVQTCLMEEIIRSSLYTTSSTSGTACDNLRNLAFDSHSKCYVEHGFCSIIRDPRNLYGLFHVLQNDVDDVDGKQAWTQVGEAITRCCRDDPSLRVTMEMLAEESVLLLRNPEVTFTFLELYNHYCDPCSHLSDDAAGDLSVVFLLDASGSIGNSDFTNMIVTTASAGVALAEIGARVGVVVFNDSATVRVPLQYWENTSQLRANIQGIPYTGGGTNIFIGLNVTASLLGNEGTRVIILLTDGKSSNRDAAEMEAEAAKRAGISIYAAGIGGSISEDELNSLASYPREEYRVYIEDFAEEALNEELQSLIASICLIPEIFTIGQELEEMLIKGRVRSLQYYLPEKGLTVTANVSGGANMYMSRTIRNPTILSANITTGGSGILSVYVSFNSSMKKPADVDTVDTSSTIFVSIIANRENTTFRASTAVGNMTIRFPPDAPVKFRVQKYTSQISYFEWYPPLRTNGIINKYTLLCIPELFGLPNCTVKIDSSIYLTALGRDITAESSCLERGLTYNCSLNATNDEGHGPPIFTQLVEDSQLKLMCSEVTLGKANCTWERLVGFILTYRVICNLTTTNTMKYNESTTELSVMVNTPTPATLHTCYVMTKTIHNDEITDFHSFVTAPGKPRKVKAWREGPDKVELTWITRRTAIEDDIIKNYNVFIYGLDKKWITNSYDKNYTLISPILRDNNLKVLIRVQAVNDAGEGPKSGAMCWYNTPRPRAN